jgi:hypothetical protein
MEPPFVDVSVQGDVARIAQHLRDLADRETIAEQFLDPRQILIELAFLDCPLGFA